MPSEAGSSTVNNNRLPPDPGDYLNQSFMEDFVLTTIKRRRSTKARMDSVIDEVYKDVVDDFTTILQKNKVPGARKISADIRRLYSAQLGASEAGEAGGSGQAGVIICHGANCNVDCRCFERGYAVGTQSGFNVKFNPQVLLNENGVNGVDLGADNSIQQQQFGGQPNGFNGLEDHLNEPNGLDNEAADPQQELNGIPTDAAVVAAASVVANGKQQKIILRNGGGKVHLGPNDQIERVPSDAEDFDAFLMNDNENTSDNDNENTSDSDKDICDCNECLEGRKKEAEEALNPKPKTIPPPIQVKAEPTEANQMIPLPVNPIVANNGTQSTAPRAQASTSQPTKPKPTYKCQAAAKASKAAPDEKMQKVRIIRQNGTYTSMISTNQPRDPRAQGSNQANNSTAVFGANAAAHHSRHAGPTLGSSSSSRVNPNHQVPGYPRTNGTTNAQMFTSSTAAPNRMATSTLTSRTASQTVFSTRVNNQYQAPAPVSTGSMISNSMFMQNPQTGLATLAPSARPLVNTSNGNAVVNALMAQNAAARAREIAEASRAKSSRPVLNGSTRLVITGLTANRVSSTASSTQVNSQSGLAGQSWSSGFAGASHARPELPEDSDSSIRRSSRVKTTSVKLKSSGYEERPKKRGRGRAAQTPSPQRHRRKPLQPQRVVDGMAVFDDDEEDDLDYDDETLDYDQSESSSQSGASSRASSPKRKRGEMSIITKALICKSNGCDAEFASKASRDNHMANVHGILPFRCWAGCYNQFFGNQAALDDHYSTVHPGDKTWRCDFCPTIGAFNQYNTLYSHLRRDHEPGRFMCNFEDCPEVFRYRSHVLLHIDRVHNPRQARSDSSSQDAPRRQSATMTEAAERIVEQQERAQAPTFRVPAVPAPHARRAPSGGGRPASAAATTKRPRSTASSVSGGHQFYCMWPECHFDARLKWNLKYHIRTLHFRLPKTIKEQKELGIVDDRNAEDFVGNRGQ